MWASVPAPEAPSLGVVLREGLPDVYTSIGSAFLPGPTYLEVQFPWGRAESQFQGTRQFAGLLQHLAFFPIPGERLREMWERDVGSKRKMPKQNGLFRKCAGGSWRKLFFLLFFS